MPGIAAAPDAAAPSGALDGPGGSPPGTPVPRTPNPWADRMDQVQQSLRRFVEDYEDAAVRTSNKLSEVAWCCQHQKHLNSDMWQRLAALETRARRYVCLLTCVWFYVLHACYIALQM